MAQPPISVVERSARTSSLRLFTLSLLITIFLIGSTLMLVSAAVINTKLNPEPIAGGNVWINTISPDGSRVGSGAERLSTELPDGFHTDSFGGNPVLFGEQICMSYGVVDTATSRERKSLYSACYPAQFPSRQRVYLPVVLG